MKKVLKKILLPQFIKDGVDYEKFESVSGSDDEKFFCSLLIAFMSPDVAFDARQFITAYQAFWKMITGGFVLDQSLHSDIMTTPLIQKAMSMRDKDLDVLGFDSVRTIAHFMIDDEEFKSELEMALSERTAMNLLEECFPGGTMIAVE